MSQVDPERPYMVRAIELARKCASEAGKISPKVGALVVRDGVVLGEAYRGELDPGDHAEYTLLERKLGGANLEGTTLYTTLEPCTIRGDGKIPCVNRIIARKIAKVYIGALDPNRAIQGEGQQMLLDAGIDVALFDPDMMKEIRELNAEFYRQHRPMKDRTYAETHDPVEPGQVGENGGRIGYMPNGDKVEWLTDDEFPGELLPLLLRRNDKSIVAMYRELWDKVWWNHQQSRLQRVAAGEVELTTMDRHLLKSNEKVLKQIEEKYGIENLLLDDFDLGLLNGRMSGLAWVMGSEWGESLDT
jgi:pyrimidine deaminase RibD-like protein